jgi:cell division protein FtsW
MAMGVWLIASVSPSVTLQHKWSAFVLLKRHLIILVPGMLILLASTLAGKKGIVQMAVVMGILAWGAVWGTLGFGIEIKGARRWLSLLGFSLQPSEFLKPALSIIVAFVLAQHSKSTSKFLYAMGITLLTLLPLALQPDLGMMFLLCLGSFGQCFVAGLSFRAIGVLFCMALCSAIGAYFAFPHAAHRIQVFLGAGVEDPFGSQYQIMQALKGFAAGGLLGKGPGSGTLLAALPDGHADFIFAAAGEELGLVVCLILLGLYGLIGVRSVWIAFQEMDLFYVLALVGLSLQFSFQVILNLASVLRLVPTKGVTLPFLSYGGSSFLSWCWGIGMMLALSRRYRGLSYFARK